MAMMRGFESKVDITVGSQTVPYNAKSWTVDYSTPPNDVSGTEGIPGNAAGGIAIGKQARLGGLDGGKITINSVTFDPTANEFGNPLTLHVSEFIKVEIYPAGRGQPGHEFQSVLITRLSQQMTDVNGLTPLTIEGETDGNFTTPESGS